MENEKIEVLLSHNNTITKYSLEEYNELRLKNKEIYPELTQEILQPHIKQYRKAIKNGPVQILLRQRKENTISNFEKFLTAGGVAAHMANLLEGVNHSFVNLVGLVGFVVGSNIIHKVYNPEKSLKKASILTLGSAALFVASAKILPDNDFQSFVNLGLFYGVGAGLIGFANNLISKDDKKNKIK